MSPPTARRALIGGVLAFAFAYFLSALLRAVTATLAPVFSSELALQSADLGLLAGAYFLGFAAMQLPLGHGLDRWGPKRVLLALMVLAVAGTAAFAMAGSLTALLAARTLIGMGVAACLMAPLTAFRRLFAPATQLRLNSWMLMTGSLGMVASTLPVQALLPLVGWRGLFVLLAVLLLVAMGAIAVAVPADPPRPAAGDTAAPHAAPAAPDGGYGEIVRHPLFVRLAPLAVLQYGGLIAVQALWAGPWMTVVAGYSPAEAAAGLFAINVCMLLTFLAWGTVMPRLAARGVTALDVARRGMPLALALLALAIWAGPAAGAAHWALWCVASTCVSMTQPAVGQAFPAHQAGRALSAYNLLIFGGVFAVQWAIGLAIDALAAAGWSPADAHRGAFAAFGATTLLAYAWFMLRRSDA